MNSDGAGLAFLAWVFLLVLGAIIGSWVSKDERLKAKENKELSDKEFDEQQEIHKGDC